MTVEEARERPDVITGIFNLNSLRARMVFDTGASVSFISVVRPVPPSRGPKESAARLLEESRIA